MEYNDITVPVSVMCNYMDEELYVCDGEVSVVVNGETYSGYIVYSSALYNDGGTDINRGST